MKLPWQTLAVLVTLLLPPAVQPDPFTSVFKVQKADLRSTGRNPYFVLEPGFTAVLDGGGEHLTITVLRQTKVVDGVETRVVEERELKDGKLIEVSRNYFAIDPKTADVYYFGEDVDMYRDGHIVSHDGSWLAGVRKARFGMIMPGKPAIGMRHYQEVAPDQAMDRAEVVSMSEVLATPAGTFKTCLKVEETTPLEPGAKEYKLYAPGVGLIQEGAMKLVSVSGPAGGS
jgi:hypothetical protein